MHDDVTPWPSPGSGPKFSSLTQPVIELEPRNKNHRVGSNQEQLSVSNTLTFDLNMASKTKVNVRKNGKNGDLWYHFISNEPIAPKSVTFDCSWSEVSNSVLLKHLSHNYLSKDNFSLKNGRFARQ